MERLETTREIVVSMERVAGVVAGVGKGGVVVKVRRLFPEGVTTPIGWLSMVRYRLGVRGRGLRLIDLSYWLTADYS